MRSAPPRRVLLWSTPGFGDVLFATPLIRSIRRAHPEAAIDVIVSSGREAMLVGNPDVRRVIAIPKRTGVLQFLRLLRRTIGRYDLAAHVMGGERAMVVHRLASRRCVSVVHPTSWSELWRRIVASDWIPRDPNEHQILRHMRLADKIGVERCYEVVPPHDEGADARLDDVLEGRTEPYAVLHPATHATRKRWTVEGWQALGQRLVERAWRCILTGGPNEDMGYLKTIRDGIGANAHSVAGQLTMAEVRALIERSQFYAGVDTSTTHMAAALGVPTLAIYGPGPTNRWAPWPHGYASNEPPFRDALGVAINGNVCLIQADCPCGKDYRNGCGKQIPGRSRCLEELRTGFVLDAVERFLLPLRSR